MLACALTLLLLCSSAWAQTPRQCTADDYEVSYTECHSDNTRDVVWYLRNGANCSGGVQAPSPIYGLPCSISCSAGYFLPIGQSTCQQCRAGQFSIGGGYREDTWYMWPSFFPFSRYFYATAHPTVHNTSEQGYPLQQWHLVDGIIRSGNITHNQVSVLELSVYVVSSTAHVSFTYRVNAERSFDGLQFDVDGVISLPKTSYVSNFVTFTQALTPGVHVLRWSYIKDVSVNYLEDSAFIQMIEVGGLFFADEACEPCAEGTFNSAPGSTSCIPCPANTYSNDSNGADECTPCPANQYSYSEAATCIPRPSCTSDDYEWIEGPCTAGAVRTLTAQWLTPVICDITNAQLPPPQTNIPCGTCSDGSTRNLNTWQCDYCPAGQNSTGGQPCQPCPAGTVAIKTHSVTTFNDWVPGTSTDCSGDCSGQGWVLHGTYMDSGVGHGSHMSSWFTFPTTLVADGQITFVYEVICPSEQCNLAFSTNAGVGVGVYQRTYSKTTVTLSLAAGNHNLNWTFSKFGFENNRNEKAIIYSIVITHSQEGGAATCTRCGAGMISADDATFCTACPAGFQSNDAHTQCTICPDGTFSATAGSACIPCGNGTTSLADRTGCLVTCKYTDGSRSYDLNVLRNGSTVYGPVNTTLNPNQLYYLTVCGSVPDVCYATKDTFIHSYACQQTTVTFAGTGIHEGMDIGSVLGWAPLPPNAATLYGTNVGVLMNLGYGTPACGAHYGSDIPRESHIAFLCDPSAGVGHLAPYKNIEETTAPCKYNFIWKSLYACPLCDSSDIGTYYSPCQGGQRTKTYYWLQNPPLCQSGSLPASQVVNCTETTTSCSAGTYLSEVTSNCVNCSAGQYSVGGGEHILSWSPLPGRFSTQCTTPSSSAPCTPWQAGVGGVESIGSGVGNSVLSATFDFVVAGYISFEYKLYTSNSNEQFTFMINNNEQLRLRPGTNRLGWTTVTFPLAKSLYSFAWTFTGGVTPNATSPRAGAVIKAVTLVGTDYHDDACTPCPAGFRSSGAANTCDTCGVNHYSLGDAATCTPCPAGYTALHRSSECVPSPACTAADWGYWYDDCITTTENSTRTRNPYYFEPMFCQPVGDLPEPDVVPCAQCPPGTIPDVNKPGSCTGCPDGQVLTGGKCTPVPIGSMAIKQKYYFPDGSDIFPEDWTTSCSGDCGSSGWNVRGDGSIDSGFHDDNSVDVLLKWTGAVSEYATLSFNFAVVHDGSNGLDFYVDNTFVKYFTGSGSFTQALTVGSHNITFDYWQVKGTQGLGRATLSNVIITGSMVADAGADVLQCPLGTYSNTTGATSCTLCPPGYFGGSSGANACEPCDLGYYNSAYGATACHECNGDTYTEDKAATYCSSGECRFSSFVKGVDIKFGLDGSPPSQKIDVVGPIRVGNQNFGTSFYFNFCNASVANAPCSRAGKPTHACAVEAGNTTRYWGEDFNFVSMHNTEQDIFSGSTNATFMVSFQNGDSDGCTTGVGRQMVFRFYCDADKGVSLPTPVGLRGQTFVDPCTANFDWYSIMGCPVCTESDYTTVLGDCVDGMKTAQKIRKNPCNGEQVVALPSQSCTGTVEFPIGVVFAVVGIILALIIVAVIVFIKNRKISAQYSRLKMQGASSLGNEFSLESSTDSIHTL